MNKLLVFLVLVLSAFFLFGCSDKGQLVDSCGSEPPEERNACCERVNKDTPRVMCEGEWIWDTQKMECYFACDTTNQEIANPASEYCEKQGYTLDIIEGPGGDQYGICKFDDGTECEEWEYFRGECRPGDTKIAVPVNEEQCKDLGGEWGKFGLALFERCNLPTNDANKVCTDSSQCEAGLCISDSPGAISGKCPAWKLNFGCMNIIENGKSMQICID